MPLDLSAAEKPLDERGASPGLNLAAAKTPLASPPPSIGGLNLSAAEKPLDERPAPRPKQRQANVTPMSKPYQAPGGSPLASFAQPVNQWAGQRARNLGDAAQWIAGSPLARGVDAVLGAPERAEQSWIVEGNPLKGVFDPEGSTEVTHQLEKKEAPAIQRAMDWVAEHIPGGTLSPEDQAHNARLPQIDPAIGQALLDFVTQTAHDPQTQAALLATIGSAIPGVDVVAAPVAAVLDPIVIAKFAGRAAHMAGGGRLAEALTSKVPEGIKTATSRFVEKAKSDFSTSHDPLKGYTQPGLNLQRAREGAMWLQRKQRMDEYHAALLPMEDEINRLDAVMRERGLNATDLRTPEGISSLPPANRRTLRRINQITDKVLWREATPEVRRSMRARGFTPTAEEAALPHTNLVSTDFGNRYLPEQQVYDKDAAAELHAARGWSYNRGGVKKSKFDISKEGFATPEAPLFQRLGERLESSAYLEPKRRMEQTMIRELGLTPSQSSRTTERIGELQERLRLTPRKEQLLGRLSPEQRSAAEQFLNGEVDVVADPKVMEAARRVQHAEAQRNALEHHLGRYHALLGRQTEEAAGNVGRQKQYLRPEAAQTQTKLSGVLRGEQEATARAIRDSGFLGKSLEHAFGDEGERLGHAGTGVATERANRTAIEARRAQQLEEHARKKLRRSGESLAKEAARAAGAVEKGKGTLSAQAERGFDAGIKANRNLTEGLKGVPGLNEQQQVGYARSGGGISPEGLTGKIEGQAAVDAETARKAAAKLHGQRGQVTLGGTSPEGEDFGVAGQAAKAVDRLSALDNHERKIADLSAGKSEGEKSGLEGKLAKAIENEEKQTQIIRSLEEHQYALTAESSSKFFNRNKENAESEDRALEATRNQLRIRSEALSKLREERKLLESQLKKAVSLHPTQSKNVAESPKKETLAPLKEPVPISKKASAEPEETLKDFQSRMKSLAERKAALDTLANAANPPLESSAGGKIGKILDEQIAKVANPKRKPATKKSAKIPYHHVAPPVAEEQHFFQPETQTLLNRKGQKLRGTIDPAYNALLRATRAETINRPFQETAAKVSRIGGKSTTKPLTDVSERLQKNVVTRAKTAKKAAEKQHGLLQRNEAVKELENRLAADPRYQASISMPSAVNERLFGPKVYPQPNILGDVAGIMRNALFSNPFPHYLGNILEQQGLAGGGVRSTPAGIAESVRLARNDPAALKRLEEAQRHGALYEHGYEENIQGTNPFERVARTLQGGLTKGEQGQASVLFHKHIGEGMGPEDAAEEVRQTFGRPHEYSTVAQSLMQSGGPFANWVTSTVPRSTRKMLKNPASRRGLEMYARSLRDVNEDVMEPEYGVDFSPGGFASRAAELLLNPGQYFSTQSLQSPLSTFGKESETYPLDLATSLIPYAGAIKNTVMQPLSDKERVRGGYKPLPLLMRGASAVRGGYFKRAETRRHALLRELQRRGLLQ